VSTVVVVVVLSVVLQKEGKVERQEREREINERESDKRERAREIRETES
jgi:hypothetical protein